GAHGHAGAAVGAERRLVSRDGDRLVLVDRRPVRPGQDSQAAERLEGAGERVNVIGPTVGDGARAQAEEHAVTSDRDLDVHALGAGLRRRGEALTPLLYPLHRRTELAGHRCDRDVLRKDVALEAEAAADVGDQEPHTRRGKVEHGREGRLEDGGRLGGRPHRERLAIPVGEDTARLERRRRAPRVLERLAQNQRRARERAIDVALAVAAAEEDTVRRERGVDRREHRERLVLDPDELASVGSEVATRRHDRGDRLAAEVDAAVAPEQAGILDAFDPGARVADQAPPRTRGSTSPAISSSWSIPQLSGFSTIVSTPPSSASIRALIRSASSSASPSR